MLAGRGFDSNDFRSTMAEWGVWASLEPLWSRPNVLDFSPRLYRCRNSVKHFLGKPKHFLRWQGAW